MVDSAFNKGSVVNLDEFERRLRGATTSNDATDDPLADLARLVGNDDVQPAARANIFSQPARGLRSISPGSAPARQQRIEPSLAPMASAPEPEVSSQPAANAVNMVASAPELRGTQPEAQSAFERQLQELHMRTEAMRRAADEAGQAHATPTEEAAQPSQDYALAQDYAPDENYDRANFGAANNVTHISEYITPQNGHMDPTGAETVAAPAASKSSRPMFVMALIFALGLFGLAVTFVTRNNHGSALAGVPLIKADNAPVRVSPPTADKPKPTDQGASILDSAAAQKVEAANKPASKVVASAEQPLDLGQLPPPNAAPAAASAPDAAQTAPNLDGFDFHKVKTVAVRPDGTLIGQPDVAPAASAAPSPAQPVMGLTPPVMPTAMTPDPAPLPVLAPAPEPMAAAPAPAPAPVAVDHADAAPLPPTNHPKVTARAAKITHHPAKAKPATEHLDSSKPLQLAQVTRAGNAETANDAAPAAAEDGATAGSYSVQLAAPGSEAEAKVVMKRLSAKFGAQLQGHHLSYHRASVNGHNIFRVRLQGLSHGSAVDVCVNLKKHGGSCFVARN